MELVELPKFESEVRLMVVELPPADMVRFIFSILKAFNEALEPLKEGLERTPNEWRRGLLLVIFEYICWLIAVMLAGAGNRLITHREIHNSQNCQPLMRCFGFFWFYVIWMHAGAVRSEVPDPCRTGVKK